MAEWSIAPVLKTGRLARASGVQIPLSPPLQTPAHTLPPNGECERTSTTSCLSLSAFLASRESVLSHSPFRVFLSVGLRWRRDGESWGQPRCFGEASHGGSQKAQEGVFASRERSECGPQGEGQEGLSEIPLSFQFRTRGHGVLLRGNRVVELRDQGSGVQPVLRVLEGMLSNCGFTSLM